MQNQLIQPDEAGLVSEAGAPVQRDRSGPPAPAAKPASVLNTGWEVVVGRIVGMAEGAEILVEVPRSNSGVMKARSVVAISRREVGQQAVLAFEDGDLSKPIILGLITATGKTAGKVMFGSEGDKFVVLAEREIELRCGEASITLTRAGKVLIKGEYVLTRAKGVNRIKGAAVSIN